jgi:hypothetical protein
MRKIRVYDRDALYRFYETEFPGVNIMMDWRHLEGADRRIGLTVDGRRWVFPESGTSIYTPPDTAARVQRALAECPWVWDEVDETPLGFDPGAQG